MHSLCVLGIHRDCSMLDDIVCVCFCVCMLYICVLNVSLSGGVCEVCVMKVVCVQLHLYRFVNECMRLCVCVCVCARA